MTAHIAKDVELKDQYVNMGVSIGKEVASKMKEKCGDGTTSTILLLLALVQNGMKNIASGSSPIEIKRGMEKAIDAILSQLKNLPYPLKMTKKSSISQTASASGNEEIGLADRRCYSKKLGNRE